MRPIYTIFSLILTALVSFAAGLTAPPGYSVQSLAPLGGEVLKPTDWFFRCTTTKDAAVYQITKEDTAKLHGYETGLTINVVPAIHKTSGQPTSDYIEYFFGKKREEGGKLVSQDEVSYQGDFVRFGFLIDQEITALGKKKVHRISYVLFANDKTDLLAIMIFGCPREDWEKNAPICRTICDHIMLFDRDRSTLPNPESCVPR